MSGIRRCIPSARLLQSSRSSRPVPLPSYVSSSLYNHTHGFVRRNAVVAKASSKQYLRAISSLGGERPFIGRSSTRSRGISEHATIREQHGGSTGFTVLADADTDITVESLAPEIARLHHRSGEGEPELLVLATPQFHRLLTANDELSSALAARMSALIDPMAEVNVTLGIVPRIPWPRPSLFEQQDGTPHETSTEYTAGAEGITVTSLPQPSEVAERNDDQSLDAGGYIYTYATPGTDQAETDAPLRGPRLGLQLADTNLLTGENYFLRHQVWARLRPGSDFQKTSDHSIWSYEMQLPGLDGGALRDTLSVAAGRSMFVSPPRTVASAFGNVIKSFDGADLLATSKAGNNTENANAVSASAEIERFAHDIKAEKYFSSPPEIWAVVEAPGTPSSHLAAATESDSSTSNLLRSLDRGTARIFRVNGGGGGWEGSAGGNISLEVDDEGDSSPFPSFSSSRSLDSAADDDGSFSLPDLFSSTVKSGDIVTFMAVGPRKDRGLEGLRSEEGAVEGVKSSFKLVAGCADGEHSAPPRFGKRVFRDYFGALSHRVAYRGVGEESGKKITGTRLPSYSGLDVVLPVQEGGSGS